MSDGKRTGSDQQVQNGQNMRHGHSHRHKGRNRSRWPVGARRTLRKVANVRCDSSICYVLGRFSAERFGIWPKALVTESSQRQRVLHLWKVALPNRYQGPQLLVHANWTGPSVGRRPAVCWPSFGRKWQRPECGRDDKIVFSWRSPRRGTLWRKLEAHSRRSSPLERISCMHRLIPRYVYLRRGDGRQSGLFRGRFSMVESTLRRSPKEILA